jgi:hypothetical protein
MDNIDNMCESQEKSTENQVGERKVKYLPLKRNLDEDTRLQSVVLHYGGKGVYSLHRGRGDDDAFYITDHKDPEKILMVITRDLWEAVFESDY